MIPHPRIKCPIHGPTQSKQATKHSQHASTVSGFKTLRRNLLQTNELSLLAVRTLKGTRLHRRRREGVTSTATSPSPTGGRVVLVLRWLAVEAGVGVVEKGADSWHAGTDEGEIDFDEGPDAYWNDGFYMMSAIRQTTVLVLVRHVLVGFSSKTRLIDETSRKMETMVTLAGRLTSPSNPPIK